MDYAMLLSKIFGPVLILAGLWFFFSKNHLTQVVESFKDETASFFMGGLVNLIIGFTVLTLYSDWGWRAETAVTVFGWLLIIRGLTVLYFPQEAMQYTMKAVKHHRIIALVPLILGIIMLCYGYPHFQG